MFLDAALNEVEELYELRVGSASSKKMSMVLADPSYNPRSAQGQTSCGRGVFSKNDIENAVSSLSNVMASRAHSPFFCIKFMHFHSREILCAGM